MSSESLECPCCGDAAALTDALGRYYDSEPLVCGCPGQLSLDSETDAYIILDDAVDCVACQLRARVAKLESAIEKHRLYMWGSECRVDHDCDRDLYLVLATDTEGETTDE